MRCDNCLEPQTEDSPFEFVSKDVLLFCEFCFDTIYTVVNFPVKKEENR